MDICIVGTGYVGLVAAACFAEMGNRVICVDNNPRVIETLKTGNIHIFEPGLEDIVRRNLDQHRLGFASELGEGIEKSLFIFNCVGTPPKPDGSCDLSYVDEVAVQIGRLITGYRIIVNKSTVPVGTADRIRGIVLDELSLRNLSIDFDVVSNPEFLKEGDAVNDFMKPDRVIIGTDIPRAAELLGTLYAPFARSRDKLIIMGERSAEMTKYAANCMLATKISFINEIANICEQVGADIKEVRMGIGADHRIGYHFIYPGVGYGGSCFPKDVNALIHTAKTGNYTPELLTAVENVNNRQKLLLARKVEEYFKPQGGVKDRLLAVWGLAFKANTDDIRDSAAISVIRHLADLGMRIRAFDPAAGENARAALADIPLIEVVNDQYDMLNRADALAVLTDWNQFRNPDFIRMKKALNAPVVFDGRNLYPSKLMLNSGITYFSIGRRPAG